jgi:hypothetical protein
VNGVEGRLRVHEEDQSDDFNTMLLISAPLSAHLSDAPLAMR